MDFDVFIKKVIDSARENNSDLHLEFRDGFVEIMIIDSGGCDFSTWEFGKPLDEQKDFEDLKNMLDFKAN